MKYVGYGRYVGRGPSVESMRFQNALNRRQSEDRISGYCVFGWGHSDWRTSAYRAHVRNGGASWPPSVSGINTVLTVVS